MRDIQDVLNFREDLSPFIVHLTKRGYFNSEIKFQTAKSALENIIKSKQLICAKYPKVNSLFKNNMSVACYGMNTSRMDEDEMRELFSSVSFTETPLNEVHSLLNINNHSVNLEPYGLVFLRKELEAKGVSPVLYLNNILGDKDTMVRTLCDLKDTNLAVATKLLPMISIFGKKLTPAPSTPHVDGEKYRDIDFLWEREWRYPYSEGPLRFNREDIFIGLCPDDEIRDFEKLAEDSELKKLKFVDPRRNMKYYANKLIDSRKVLKDEYGIEIKSSVV